MEKPIGLCSKHIMYMYKIRRSVCNNVCLARAHSGFDNNINHLDGHQSSSYDKEHAMTSNPYWFIALRVTGLLWF